MAHRSDRDRDQGGRDRGDRPRRGDRDTREPGHDRGERDSGLNEFFVDGEGIHREVMQREICKYLGPEAWSRPSVYNGRNGYLVKAVRPFTPKMIDDLQNLSEDYMSENRNLSRRGYEGVPYTQSQTSRRSDREISVANSQDTYSSDPYAQQPAYSASAQSGFTPNAGYPPGSNYPSSQVPGYSSVQGYPQVPGYPVGSAYPQGSGYPSGSSYSATSGYSAPGYPATVARAAESNYTYDPADYPNSNYQYRQQGAYTSGTRPGDPRADPRAASGYPYVSSSSDVSVRGVAADRYDSYGQPIGLGPAQSGRAGFPAPTRGPPTGYDPPQPMDGGYRGEPERRRR